jgi:aryl-alcohol dehydrogenase-like predicted oxidoreductase
LASTFPCKLPGDFRGVSPRFQQGNVEANLRLADALGQVAQARSVSVAQVAIAWVLAQGEHMLPIPGTKREHYLEEDLGAAAVALDDEALAELAALPAPVGARYP